MYICAYVCVYQFAGLPASLPDFLVVEYRMVTKVMQLSTLHYVIDQEKLTTSCAYQVIFLYFLKRVVADIGLFYNIRRSSRRVKSVTTLLPDTSLKLFSAIEEHKCII